MAIIARSDPIKIDVGATPTPITPAPVTPTPIVTPSNVLERHRQFIGKIDASKACFTKEAIAGFTGDEFTLHLEIAKIDKYVADAGSGLFCSKAAVEELSKSLERLKV